MSQDLPKSEQEKFLRELYDLTLRDMERTRNYFEALLRTTMVAGGIIIAVGLFVFGFLSFRTWSDVERNIVAKGEAAIAEMDTHIRDRAEKAFQEDSIRQYVRDVAKQKTEQELSKIIRDTVTTQVATTLKNKEAEIGKVVSGETKRAVEALSPRITAEVDNQVRVSLGPLRQRVDEFQEVLNTGTLAILARNGNGKAYDQLERVSTEAKDPVLREISVSTINQLFVEYNGGIYPGRRFTQQKTAEEMKELLKSDDVLVRWAAVDGLAAANEASIVPSLIHLINTDSSMFVRRAAYVALGSLTKQQIAVLDKRGWNDWWDKNKSIWLAR